MRKVYISSSYLDLKECRDSVYRILRSLRYDAMAMEDYVASDQRPLDRCLKDVGQCDAYVGIFAWRYGYIPDADNPGKIGHRARVSSRPPAGQALSHLPARPESLLAERPDG